MSVDLETIVSLAKRRGFIFPSSEIYGGLAGIYDYGPLGLALKNNIKNLWWRMFVEEREDMYGVDASIIMNSKVWEASGHVAGFSDPVVECKFCGTRFRVDPNFSGETATLQMIAHLQKCPINNNPLSGSFERVKIDKQDIKNFNLMLETHLGASQGDASKTYLRPETAQGMFVNFKNIVDSFHPKLPFGLAQIGKAFRNEIAPRDFLFRLREFEQMEVEYFVRPSDSEWEKVFTEWHGLMRLWISAIGLPSDKIHELKVPDGERAHYSQRTIDFEFDFPFGCKELYGLAYRGNYDLTQHQLEYLDEETGEKIIPHVIEPSLGVERTILAILCSAYSEDELGGEKRVYLKFKPAIAPIKVAVFPLLKNKPELVTKARELYQVLKKELGAVVFDDNGNIGKRYRRQDEIGTPWCVTVDFDTLGEKPELKDTVTVRDRDTGQQQRQSLGELSNYLRNLLK